MSKELAKQFAHARACWVTVSAGGRKAVSGDVRLWTAMKEQSRLWTAVHGGALFLIDWSKLHLQPEMSSEWTQKLTNGADIRPSLPVFNRDNSHSSRREYEAASVWRHLTPNEVSIK